MDELRLLRAYQEDRQYLKEYAHARSWTVHELLRKLVEDLKSNKIKIGS